MTRRAVKLACSSGWVPAIDPHAGAVAEPLEILTAKRLARNTGNAQRIVAGNIRTGKQAAQIGRDAAGDGGEVAFLGFALGGL